MIDTNSETYKKFVEVTHMRAKIELAALDFVEKYFDETDRQAVDAMLSANPKDNSWISFVLSEATSQANDLFHKLHDPKL